MENLNAGSIYHIPSDAKFEVLDPRPEVLSIAQEIQRQNAEIQRQNAMLATALVFGPRFVISSEVDPSTLGGL